MLIDTLKKNGIDKSEILYIVKAIEENYYESVNEIIKEYETDFMMLENVSTPLDLFVISMEKIDFHKLSSVSRIILSKYIMTLRKLNI